MTPEEAVQQNLAVQAWDKATFGQVKSRYLSMINSPKRSGEGFESLHDQIGKKFGVIERISYKFNRYLVFLHKGVGRGRPIGSDKVKPKEWLNPVLDQQVPLLADIVASIKADQAVNAIQII